MAQETYRSELISAPRVNAGSRRGEVMVFCTLALLGGGLLSVVLVAHVDYFYPYMFYLLVVFIAWQRYFQRGSKRRLPTGIDELRKQEEYLKRLKEAISEGKFVVREEQREHGKISSD